MVKPDEVDDNEMVHISRSIAKGRGGLEYPGQIKLML